MRRYLFLVTAALLICMYACTKDNNPVNPDNGNDTNDDPPAIVYGDTANAVTCPQQDIPWPTLADAPWPMAFRTPQGVARANLPGPETGEIGMQIELPSWGVNYTQPVIGPDNKIFITPFDEGLLAYTFEGEFLWQLLTDSLKTLKRSGFCTPVIGSDGNIYSLASTTSETTKVFSVTPDGEIRWILKVTGRYISNLNIDKEGNLFFCTGDGFLHSVSSIEGQENWKTQGNGGYENYTTLRTFPISPEGGVIYVAGNNGGGTIDAISTADGNVLWSYQTTLKRLPCLMVDNAGRIYASERSGEYQSDFICLDPHTGAVIWRYVISDRKKVGGRASVIDNKGYIYVLTWDSEGSLLYSFDYEGKLRWKRNLFLEDKWFITEGSFLYCDSRNRIYTFAYERLSDIPYFYTFDQQGEILIETKTGTTDELPASLGPNSLLFYTEISESYVGDFIVQVK